MKITMEMDNLTGLIESAVTKNIETVIQEQVDLRTKAEIEKRAKEIIPEVVSEQLQEYIKGFITQATITEGGGLYSKEPAKEYTVEEFIKKEIAERLQSQNLKIKSDSKYGDRFEEVTFEEFIKKEFDVNKLINNKLVWFISETKKEINERIDATFTDVTKNMLSEIVYNVLLRNDTFTKLSENIKCIADKRE